MATDQMCQLSKKGHWFSGVLHDLKQNNWLQSLRLYEHYEHFSIEIDCFQSR